MEIEILRLDDEGFGVGRFGKEEVVVPLALPGERIAARIEWRGRDRAVARIERVLVASPDRRRSPCIHTPACVGCPFVNIAYLVQLGLKRDRVLAALGRYPELSQTVVHDVWAAANEFGYRTSAKLVVVRKGADVIIGMNRPGTRQVVDISRCPVHHPLINAIAGALRDEIKRQRIGVFDPITGRGFLRFVAVRVSPFRPTAMVTFITFERERTALAHLAKGLVARVGEVKSVHGSVNTSDSGMVMGRDTFRILGTPDLYDQVGDVRLKISPAAFFQVNHVQAARIYERVRSWAALSRDETAVDLYCGIGPIALNLAKDAGKVLGFEIVADAVRDARANATANSLSNCTFRAGDAVEQLRESIGRVGSPAVITVNPPRSGCELEVLNAMTSLRPRMMVYVSCHPDTLSRDLDILAGLGYRTTDVQPVDMFPQTAHVECVARIVPGA